MTAGNIQSTEPSAVTMLYVFMKSWKLSSALWSGCVGSAGVGKLGRGWFGVVRVGVGWNRSSVDWAEGDGLEVEWAWLWFD